MQKLREQNSKLSASEDGLAGSSQPLAVYTRCNDVICQRLLDERVGWIGHGNDRSLGFAAFQGLDIHFHHASSLPNLCVSQG